MHCPRPTAQSPCSQLHVELHVNIFSFASDLGCKSDCSTSAFASHLQGLRRSDFENCFAESHGAHVMKHGYGWSDLLRHVFNPQAFFSLKSFDWSPSPPLPCFGQCRALMEWCCLQPLSKARQTMDALWMVVQVPKKLRMRMRRPTLMRQSHLHPSHGESPEELSKWIWDELSHQPR